MRRWALVAKLTKSLECKHEQLVTWRSPVYQSREVESEQWQIFAKLHFLERESPDPKECWVPCRVTQMPLWHWHKYTQPLPNTASLRDSFQNSPLTHRSNCVQLWTILTHRSNCAQLLYNSAHFWKSRLLTASARSQIWQIYPKRSGARAIKTSQSRIECRWWCRLTERSSVGIREPKTSWRSFMTVAGNERG